MGLPTTLIPHLTKLASHNLRRPLFTARRSAVFISNEVLGTACSASDSGRVFAGGTRLRRAAAKGPNNTGLETWTYWTWIFSVVMTAYGWGAEHFCVSVLFGFEAAAVFSYIFFLPTSLRSVW